MFVWGAKLYFETYSPPPNALEIHVVAKQWMWKAQHPEGRSEIDELHVPVGRPIKLLLTSQDVIHDFFVPAFRIKTDVVPGPLHDGVVRSERRPACSVFFAPSIAARSTPACSGASWSWRRGSTRAGSAAVPSGVTRAEAGAKLFQSLGCATCHAESSTSRGPSLAGLFGKTGAAAGRENHHRRRNVYSRVDHQSPGKDRRRLSADHAHVQGSGHRRRDFADHCVSQILDRPEEGAAGKQDERTIPWNAGCII